MNIKITVVCARVDVLTFCTNTLCAVACDDSRHCRQYRQFSSCSGTSPPPNYISPIIFSRLCDGKALEGIDVLPASCRLCSPARSPVQSAPGGVAVHATRRYLFVIRTLVDNIAKNWSAICCNHQALCSSRGRSISPLPVAPVAGRRPRALRPDFRHGGRP